MDLPIGVMSAGDVWGPKYLGMNGSATPCDADRGHTGPKYLGNILEIHDIENKMHDTM